MQLHLHHGSQAHFFTGECPHFMLFQFGTQGQLRQQLRPTAFLLCYKKKEWVGNAGVSGFSPEHIHVSCWVPLVENMSRILVLYPTSQPPEEGSVTADIDRQGNWAQKSSKTGSAHNWQMAAIATGGSWVYKHLYLGTMPLLSLNLNIGWYVPPQKRGNWHGDFKYLLYYCIFVTITTQILLFLNMSLIISALNLPGIFIWLLPKRTSYLNELYILTFFKSK